MALLSAKNVREMKEKDLQDKLAELRLELLKGGVTAKKAQAKTKEIKKAIARILTFTKAQKKAFVKNK